MRIKEEKIKQFFLWLLAYTPIIVIIVIKGFEFKWYYAMLFIMLIYFVYFCSGKIFLDLTIKYIKKNQLKIGKISDYENVSINEYTYFILTLFMPLLFEDINSTFDYIIFGTLMLIIILIFTNLNYIIVNPIFILGKFNIYKVTFKNIDKSIKGYAIVKKGLDLDDDLNYIKIFSGVFYFYEENED